MVGVTPTPVREDPDVLHRYTPWLVLALGAGVLFVNRPTAAEDPPAKEKSKADEKGKSKPDESAGSKPATVKVEKGPFTSAVTLKGVVQAEEATELSVRLKTWTGPLVARKAVEHGAAVKAGEVVVEFDPEKLDHALRDARQERDLAELAIRQAEQELPILEKQAPLDLAVAEKEFKQTSEDLKRFLEVDRKMAVQSAEFMLKSANFYVEYAKDELKQLQKMYRDKDLTEETEQMILKRYKHSLEMDEFFAAQTKLRAEQTLKVDLPRREQTDRDAVAKAELALAKARDVQPLAVQQKRLALAHLRYEQAKAKEHLADLEKDLAALTVRAPADGLAYHGRFVRGQWMVPAGTQGPVLLGVGQLNPGDVFLTVVAPGKLIVRAETEEKELPGLKPALAGKLTPTAFPDRKVPVELTRVATAPQEGKFEVRINLDGKGADGLVPGMTCVARFVTARKEAALTVPASAVFEDVAEDTHYVYRPTKPGKHEKKTVKVGLTSGDRVEILDGLADGDEILSSKP
ncbi:MAG: Macrolide-specific efflux protein macA precursor [Gemmataceae bacterium]|nr:Macrolide-specific efflux protein macA precursor [Gemmataceae bacterium]